MWELSLTVGLLIFMIFKTLNQARQKSEAVLTEIDQQYLEQLPTKDSSEKNEFQRFIQMTSIRAHASDRPIKVVGVMDYQYELDFISEADIDGAVKRLQTVVLYPEPDNPYDENAIQVVIGEDPIGYLSAAKAEKYRPIVEWAQELGRKITCNAEIVGGSTKTNGDQANFGVRLYLESPASLKRQLEDRLRKIP